MLSYFFRSVFCTHHMVHMYLHVSTLYDVLLEGVVCVKAGEEWFGESSDSSSRELWSRKCS